MFLNVQDGEISVEFSLKEMAHGSDLADYRWYPFDEQKYQVWIEDAGIYGLNCD